MEERAFKGVWIPKEIWLDTRLNALDKIILAEIDSFDSNYGGCCASNQYIAEFCQCSERKVSEAISKLAKIGYIYIQSFNGRLRILKSNLKITIQPSKKCEADSQNLLGSLEFSASQPSKKCGADSQNLRHNNIDNNIDNKKERKKTKTPAAVTYDEAVDSYTENTALRDALRNFIKMRTFIKKPLTDRALKMIMTKLDNLSAGNDDIKIKILDQSIVHNWQDVYRLKDDDQSPQAGNQNFNSQPAAAASDYDW